ncbi:MAG: ATP-dependent zinc metalloprotease FtsH [Defluviitaleaceae bacterium]|nr:ATP-dependent zinc metalloprotease FtsH [Defluviitaleaceae bacterium]MCL2276049.1 ATP-dependent zinc metalloprotease FtsH [Defluviitaleaceae bacterium]
MALQRRSGNFALFMLVMAIILMITMLIRMGQPQETGEVYTYAHLVRDLQADRVGRIVVTPDTNVPGVGQAEVMLVNPMATHTINIPSTEIFMAFIHNYLGGRQGILYFDANAPVRPHWIIAALPLIMILGVSGLILFFVYQQTQGGGGRNMNFGKSRAKVILQDKRKVNFNQVAGLDEEKAELAEIVDFLKTPQKYNDIGARIPKGILLVGPPGTGKTYLARAVAGEADVPFYSISGSDFVEMYVGVGASRVRDLFDQAKRNPASIIIIDEIDAVGRKRGAGHGGGHDEREQTLNQLLVEMDGFALNEGVIVLAATNRPDILDPALLRPGRFDRQIVVNRPDIKGREAVLHVHAEGKKIAEDVDLRVVAQTTAGFTPADLENLLNEAALIAARENKAQVDMDAIRKAFIKVGIGTEKKSRVITEKERRITAYHEAGHAICHEILPDMDATYIISVIPTGRAGGYVMPLPGEDRNYVGKKYLEQSIIALLGGRAAEARVLGDITNGAANDIERATQTARDMVVKYGMSDTLGPIQLGNANNEVFLGRDYHNVRNYGEQVASLIDNEIKSIVESSYNEALNLIDTHIDVLHKIVELLMEKERVSGEEVRSLFPLGTLVPKDNKGGLMGEVL